MKRIKMIEAITILILGAYARGWGIDPFWFVAFAFFTGTLLSRIVRALVHWHWDRKLGK